VLFLRNLDKYEPSCKLLDVDCELASFDPTGVLVDSKSHLVLGGRLARATINASTRESLKRHTQEYEQSHSGQGPSASTLL